MYPKVSAASSERPIVIIGGLPVTAKVDALRGYGVHASWENAYHDASRIVKAVEARVRNSSCAAIILLDKLMGHKTSRPLLAACRATGLPVAYGGRGGIGELRGALEDLERQM